jgi:hypothetical protein
VSRPSRELVFSVFLGALALAPDALAGRSIHAEPMFGEKVRVDGDLREWSI